MTKRKRATLDLLPQVRSINSYTFFLIINFLEKTLPPASPCEPILRSFSSVSFFTSYRRLVGSLSSLCGYRPSPSIRRYRLRLWRSLDQSRSNISEHPYAWFVKTSLIIQYPLTTHLQAWKFVFKSHNMSMIESQHSALHLLWREEVPALPVTMCLLYAQTP